ncbi:MAG: site-2 protease family protein [Planctomycetota bacterium]
MGSFHLFTAFGIPIKAHWSFLLLVYFFASQLVEMGKSPEGSAIPMPADLATALVFVVCAMVCLLLHELGHSLTARRYGIKTREIKMFFLGGVAMIERSPREPRQELIITVAGPLVNFVIAAILFPLLLLFSNDQPAGEQSMAEQPMAYGLLAFLLAINLVFGLFNLLPGFPMDGGRILRALLALKLPYLKATHIAVRIGQLVGAAFIVLAVMGIWGGISSGLIGALILIVAQGELMRVWAEEARKNGPDLSRLFGGNSKAGAGPGTWKFTVGGQPPPGSQGAETQGDDPPPPRGDSDCVIDVDSDGKVRKIWRKDDDED